MSKKIGIGQEGKKYLTQQVVVTPDFNEIAKRKDLEIFWLKNKIETIIKSLDLKAEAFVEKKGTFGIKKASKEDAIDFINAIRKTNFAILSEMDEKLFKTGRANLNENSTLSIKDDVNGTYKVSFGSKKTTYKIIKDLHEETKIATKEEKKPGAVQLIRIDEGFKPKSKHSI